MKTGAQIFLSLWVGTVLPVIAAQPPDLRLRQVLYEDDKVVRVPVEPGFAVQIALSPTEHIVAAGTGRNSHCEDSTAGWCVVALKGGSDIYVNAHKEGVGTNLFVKTDRRNYSFDLIRVVGKQAIERIYRLQFIYPEKSAVAAQTKSTMEPAATHAAKAHVNGHYTKQALPGGDEISPSDVWDDGNFTYIRFKGRVFPAVYEVSENGNESLVHFHVEDGNLMAVHHVAKRFVLRAGEKVVGLWNEAYNPGAVVLMNGVTAPNIKRVIVDSQNVVERANTMQFSEAPFRPSGADGIGMPWKLSPDMLMRPMAAGVRESQEALTEYWGRE